MIGLYVIPICLIHVSSLGTAMLDNRHFQANNSYR